MIALLAIALVAGGYYGWRYWTEGRFLVVTDDAYVAGDITILAAKVSGYIATIEVENDRHVNKGDVVARIDDVDYRLAVQSARDKLATLEATTARIGKQVEAAKAQVAQAEPQIASARADRLRADLEFDRQSRLSVADFASKAKFEQARADRDRAVASVKGAEAALLVAQANVDVLEAQRTEAARTADEARTQLARAERDLAFTEIRAPVSGVVGNRAVQVGSYVTPGQRLAALIPLDTVHIDANFKETQLAPIHPGQVVRLEVDAYPGREVPATVESIAPASGSQYSLLPPENATGNFTKIVQRLPVRVKVDPKVAAEGILRPGMSVVAKVDIRDPEKARAAMEAGGHEAR
jgi:membrane fusion protein (multidrug efflux system)